MTAVPYTYEDYEAAANVIRKVASQMPKIGMILGSGLSSLADSVENATIIPYGEIPHFPVSTVRGHQGRLVFGELEGQQVLVMQGRLHYYEGYSMYQVTFPVRVMQLLGIKTLIVTNAAGGLNQNFSAGDLMLITDHINLLGHMGVNGLIGPNDERFGERFPIFTQAYDAKLRDKTLEIAEREGINIQKGVYLSLSGPAFETPAEIRMFRLWGADAVGMSTAPEVTVARHGGMRVLGISTITNMAIDDPDSKKEVSHESVLEIGRQIVPNLTRILRNVLREMPPYQGETS